MKRPQLYRLTLSFALTAFLALSASAQGSGDLPPATKPKAKPTPAPKGKPSTPKPAPGTTAGTNAPSESKPSALTRRPASTPALTFNQPVIASLEAPGTGRLATGHYYNEYVLTAKASDLLMIQFQPDSTPLSLHVYDQARAELPIVKDSMTGDYRFDTPTGTVPADGEYRVRVLNATDDKKALGAYSLKVMRTGMTEAAYSARLQLISGRFKAGETASVDETIKQLDELIAEDATKPGAYELLGVLHLYYKNDPAKAVSQMEQAIKLGGAGMFKVSYDSQWRRPKRTPGGFVWEDPKTAWLRVQEGKAVLADVSNPNQTISTLQGAQVSKLERLPVAPVVVVQTMARLVIQFSPASKNGAEADLIVRLLQTYVTKKTR
ncbi:MAG: hypothetical protein HY011_02990 [Acidobacteria bacterium]|nr:hypothetical protein [Acidobacteriota bacterium]